MDEEIDSAVRSIEEIEIQNSTNNIDITAEEVIDMEKKRTQVVLIDVLQETDKSVNKKKDTMIRKIVGKWKKGGSYLLEKLPKALLEPT